MKTLKQSCLFICLLMTLTLHSQNLTIHGLITDVSKKNIAKGQISLLHINSKQLKVTSLENGHFSFPKNISGKYTLSVYCIGFQLWEKQIILNEDIDLTIILQPYVKNLDEVILERTKKPIELKNGNILVNVANSPLQNESSVETLLRNVPKIIVDSTAETIDVIGEGQPLIYLDHQLITTEELLNLDVENIDTIELISNPSTKYEANGRVVLEIKTKQLKNSGYKGSFSKTIMQKRLFHNLLNANFKHGLGKLSYELNGAYNKRNVFEGSRSTYHIEDQQLFSNYNATGITNRNQFVFGGNVNLQLKNKGYTSFSIHRRYQKDVFQLNTKTDHRVLNTFKKVESTNDQKGFRDFFTSKFNYYTEVDKHQNIFIGAQYTQYNTGRNSEINNVFNPQQMNTTEFRDQRFNTNSIAFKLDYQNKIFNKLIIKSGFQYSRNSTQNIFEIISKPAINTFYKENRWASYVESEQQFKKWNITGGIRSEYQFSKSNLTSLSRVRLFPKALITYDISEERKWLLSYAKSINRLSFSSLNTNSVFINPFLEFQNEPSIKPTIIEKLALQLQLNKKTIKLSYLKKQHPQYLILNRNQNQVTSGFFNIPRKHEIFMEFGFPLKHKFWEAHNWLSISTNKTRLNWMPLSAYYHSNHTFKITNHLSSNINLWGLTPSKEFVFNFNAALSFNIGLDYTLNDHFKFSFRANDLFKKTEYRNIYAYNGLNSDLLFFSDQNAFSFMTKYTFGKLKSNTKSETKDVDDNLSRIH